SCFLLFRNSFFLFGLLAGDALLLFHAFARGPLFLLQLDSALALAFLPQAILFLLARELFGRAFACQLELRCGLGLGGLARKLLHFRRGRLHRRRFPQRCSTSAAPGACTSAGTGTCLACPRPAATRARSMPRLGRRGALGGLWLGFWVDHGCSWWTGAG